MRTLKAEDVAHFYESDHVNIGWLGKADTYAALGACRKKAILSSLVHETDVSFVDTTAELVESPTMVVAAINQYYPEFSSGFYQNSRIMALLQLAIEAVGLFFVEYDNYQPSGAVPYEWIGGLEDLPYYLVDREKAIRGGAVIHTPNGGKNHYLHDRRILTIIATRHDCGSILGKIKSTFPTHHRSLIKW